MKLVSLNVEMSKHWDRIVPFIEEVNADVLCLQELYTRDAAMLKDKFGYQVVHEPIIRKVYSDENPDDLDEEGPAILTKLPIKNIRKEFYYSPGPGICQYTGMKEQEKRDAYHQSVVLATVETDIGDVRIATTHFTWSKDGTSNVFQEEDTKALLEVLSDEKELLLCGDFNIPRSINELYQEFAKVYTDWIPTELDTTMDISLHRMGSHPTEGPKIATYVVDYIFSTNHYSVSHISAQAGLSDHKAIIAQIERVATQ